MEGRIVVTERRVEAADPERSGVAELITDLGALEVGFDLAMLIDLEGQFEQRTGMLAELRIQKNVERAHIGALQFGFVRVVIADADVGETVKRDAGAAAAAGRVGVGQLRQLLLYVLQALLSLRRGLRRGRGLNRRCSGPLVCKLNLEFSHSHRQLLDE